MSQRWRVSIDRARHPDNVMNATFHTLGESTLPSSTGRQGRGDDQDLHDRWAHFVAQQLCSFSIRSRGESNFRVNAWTRSEGGFVVAHFTTVAGRAQLERTPTEISRDSRDNYCLYLPLQGEHEVQQCNRDIVLKPASLTLLTTGEPYVQTKRGDNDTLYLLMPRTFVDQRLTHGEDICANVVDAQQGVGRLAMDTVASLCKQAARMSRQEFVGACNLAGELVLLGLSGVGDLTANSRSIRASNLARAKRIIRARMTDPDLAPDDVARECGLSLRYLHDLFHDDGRTVREYLVGERLHAARRMLERAVVGSATITEICMACGFSTPSVFSTAFRQAFGISPREVMRRDRKPQG
jgi:AraC-like DNA-binding protein